MKSLIGGIAFVAGFCLIAAAAPGVRPKEVRLGPITPEQMHTSRENLKEIAIAWHNYHDANGFFPSNQVSKTGKPLLSWRVQILPYVEQDALYKGFKLDEPWDSDHNRKLIDKMPKVYAPVRGKADKGTTFYQTFTGKHGLIQSGQRRGIVTITDGTSNTLMVVEAATPVIWTKPDDLVFDGKDVPALGGMFNGKFHAAFCDGSVERLRKGVNADVLRALITPQGGEVVDRKEAVDADKDKK